MPSILDEIVAAKCLELVEQKKQVSQASLEAAAAAQSRPFNLSGALLSGGVRLIAEVKKASPSRGLLSPDFDPVRLAETYVNNGAAAVSCLTDFRFQGELDHLAQIKRTGASQRAPVLRKDFLFDDYQVQIAVDVGAEIIGINNRDLHTFTTDLSVTERLAPLVPRGKVIVSESGIFTRDDLRRLNQVRVNAALVGEALVTAPDVAAKVRELSGQRIPAGGS